MLKRFVLLDMPRQIAFCSSVLNVWRQLQTCRGRYTNQDSAGVDKGGMYVQIMPCGCLSKLLFVRTTLCFDCENVSVLTEQYSVGPPSRFIVVSSCSTCVLFLRLVARAVGCCIPPLPLFQCLQGGQRDSAGLRAFDPSCFAKDVLPGNSCYRKCVERKWYEMVWYSNMI